jgi:hypothetical protein
VLAFLWSSSAGANPISMDVLRARQAPQTTHVQITYAVDSDTAPNTPSAITRDDQALSGSWTNTSSFTANTGSGLKELKAVQLCDCDVPLGERLYKVTVMPAMGSQEMEFQATVTVVDNLGAPADAGVVGDVHPWEIPEPNQIQGLDCSQECSGGGDDGGTVSPDAAVVTPDAGPTADSASPPPNPDDEDEGGCSLSGSTRGGALGLLILGLGLLGGLLRRRRR